MIYSRLKKQWCLATAHTQFLTLGFFFNDVPQFRCPQNYIQNTNVIFVSLIMAMSLKRQHVQKIFSIYIPVSRLNTWFNQYNPPCHKSLFNTTLNWPKLYDQFNPHLRCVVPFPAIAICLVRQPWAASPTLNWDHLLDIGALDQSSIYHKQAGTVWFVRRMPTWS